MKKPSKLKAKLSKILVNLVLPYLISFLVVLFIVAITSKVMPTPREIVPTAEVLLKMSGAL